MKNVLKASIACTLLIVGFSANAFAAEFVSIQCQSKQIGSNLSSTAKLLRNIEKGTLRIEYFRQSLSTAKKFNLIDCEAGKRDVSGDGEFIRCRDRNVTNSYTVSINTTNPGRAAYAEVDYIDRNGDSFRIETMKCAYRH